jgi:hypothetical protein
MRKRQKELQQTVDKLQKGDKVVTNGGLHGEVAGIEGRWCCSRSPTRSRSGVEVGDRAVEDRGPTHEQELLGRGILILWSPSDGGRLLAAEGQDQARPRPAGRHPHGAARARSRTRCAPSATRRIERLSQEAQTQGLRQLQPQPLAPTSFAVTVPPAPRQHRRRSRESSSRSGSRRSTTAASSFRLKDDARQADFPTSPSTRHSRTIDNPPQRLRRREPIIPAPAMGGDRIVVQLPGVDDPERIKEAAQEHRFLEFRIVEGGPAATRDELLASFSGQPCRRTSRYFPGVIKDETRQNVGQQFYAVQTTAKVTGRDLKNARPGTGQFNDPIVEFTFTHDGGQRFGELTGRIPVRASPSSSTTQWSSAPRIETRITDQGIIRGQFTQAGGRGPLDVLRTGALPAGIETLEERTVGPSLGRTRSATASAPASSAPCSWC